MMLVFMDFVLSNNRCQSVAFATPDNFAFGSIALSN